MLLDPHYRTQEGFRALVELHWAAFGHQFAERMGSAAPEASAAPSAAYPGGSTNHSPIFLQWIDCMAQLLRLYPTAFHYSTVRHPPPSTTHHSSGIFHALLSSGGLPHPPSSHRPFWWRSWIWFSPAASTTFCATGVWCEVCGPPLLPATVPEVERLRG